MDTPATWFLCSGLFVLFVSRWIRVTRQQLTLRRSLAAVGAVAVARIGMRGHA